MMLKLWPFSSEITQKRISKTTLLNEKFSRVVFAFLIHFPPRNRRTQAPTTNPSLMKIASHVPQAHHLKGKLSRLRRDYDRVCETRICLTVWRYDWRTENCSRSLPTMHEGSRGLIRSWWRKTASGPFLP